MASWVFVLYFWVHSGFTRGHCRDTNGIIASRTLFGHGSTHSTPTPLLFLRVSFMDDEMLFNPVRGVSIYDIQFPRTRDRAINQSLSSCTLVHAVPPALPLPEGAVIVASDSAVDIPPETS